MITPNLPFQIILNPERDLLASIFLEAWKDTRSKNKTRKNDALTFLTSPGARYFINLLDVETEFYKQWVERIKENG